MNGHEQQGGSPEKSSASTRDESLEKQYARSHGSEARTETLEDYQAASDGKEGKQPPVDQDSFAYQLLLLQQRLAAYEQLHLEEIAELRQEIERLRRAFLQETHPQLRAISPMRDKE